MEKKNFFEGKSAEEIKKFFAIKEIKGFLLKNFKNTFTPNYAGDVNVDVFEREKKLMMDELESIAFEIVHLVKEKTTNDFAKAVATTVSEKRYISEKQAYVIARAFYEDNLHKSEIFFDFWGENFEYEIEKEVFNVMKKLDKKAEKTNA